MSKEIPPRVATEKLEQLSRKMDPANARQALEIIDYIQQGAHVETALDILTEKTLRATKVQADGAREAFAPHGRHVSTLQYGNAGDTAAEPGQLQGRSGKPIPHPGNQTPGRGGSPKRS